jgi:hypothetical protein
VLYLYDHEKKKKLGAKQAHASLTASGPYSTVLLLPQANNNYRPQ